jgi:hypothetical protein
VIVTIEQHKTELGRYNVKDGGRFMLTCQCCHAPLVEVWQTRPDDELAMRIVAKCDHCGDKSTPLDIHGAFQYSSGCHPSEPDTIYSDPDTIEHFDKGDYMLVVISTKKVQQWK